MPGLRVRVGGPEHRSIAHVGRGEVGRRLYEGPTVAESIRRVSVLYKCLTALPPAV
jgi:hypothetical protein